MNCPNCFDSSYIAGETCFVCGCGPRIGPPSPNFPEAGDDSLAVEPSTPPPEAPPPQKGRSH